MEGFYWKCPKCKFYVKHYILQGCKLREIGGRCTNRQVPSKFHKAPVKYENICEFWQELEYTPEKRKEGVKSAIHQMNERLEEILLALEADREE